MTQRELLREDIQFRVLRELENNPHITQRELSRRLGVSLGKANYCLLAVVEHGWVKVHNFTHNPNKLDYTYLLTPVGIKAKLALTRDFLARKEAEYEALRAEIAALKRAMGSILAEDGDGV